MQLGKKITAGVKSQNDLSQLHDSASPRFCGDLLLLSYFLAVRTPTEFEYPEFPNEL